MIATVKKLKRCPHCGALKTDILKDVVTGRYAVVCNAKRRGCGATAGFAGSVGVAVRKWNRRDK